MHTYCTECTHNQSPGSSGVEDDCIRLLDNAEWTWTILSRRHRHWYVPYHWTCITEYYL